MKILAIETTGSNASVALTDESGEVREEISDKRLSHLQTLIPMVDILLKNCALGINDVTHIAVSEGPGSFTGIRIGMATAKGLAQALNLPAISVPTLRSFAWHVPDYKGLICPVFNARREQVYAGAYYWNNGRCFQAVKDDAWNLGDYLSAIDEFDAAKEREVLFFGDGISVFEEDLLQWAISTKRLSSKDDGARILAAPELRLQRAASVVRAALEMAQEGGAVDFELLRPVYLRKSEAERKLEQKQKLTGNTSW